MTSHTPNTAGEVSRTSPAVSLFRRGAGARVADTAYLLGAALATAAGVVVGIYLIIRMLGQANPTWDEIGFWEFATGREWAPSLGKFGALPAVYGTVVTALIAMVVAVPLAIGVAIATTVVLPRSIRRPVAIVIDLLAAIPSVVYGLWGFIVLVPLVRPFFTWISEHNGGVGALAGPVLGQSLLLASLVLAVMILPIITAVIRDVLAETPVDQREAAMALGATRWEMIRGSMLPWARSGIVGASALGLGRAVGETIAVAMVLGSQPTLFASLLGSGQTIAGTIAFQYNSADSALHASSLVAMAILLLAVSLIINLAGRMVISRSPVRRRFSVRERLSSIVARPMPHLSRVRGRVLRFGLLARTTGRGRVRRPSVPTVTLSRRIRSWVAEALLILCVVVALVPLTMVLGYCVVKGAGAITPDFFTSDGEPDLEGNGIGHALIGTVTMLAIATAVAVPLGVLTAVFVREATARGGVLGRMADGVGVFVDVLLGLPSIVAGLAISLVVVARFGFSAIAGGLALAVVMYPIIARSADEGLRLVRSEQVEAAIALGAPRWRTAVRVILPAAAPGILTGIMLAVARASGETAPLLLTADSNQFFSTDVTGSIAALPVYIFNGTISSTVPIAQEHAWGAALVLVMVVLIVNLVARFVGRRSSGSEAR